jgi:tRNA A58 N-methylase Trm61
MVSARHAEETSMNWRKTLRQIESVLEQLESRGALKSEVRETIERGLVRIKRGYQKGDRKLIESGIEQIVRALLK